MCTSKKVEQRISIKLCDPNIYIHIYIKEARSSDVVPFVVSKYVRVATISKCHINICLRVSRVTIN